MNNKRLLPLLLLLGSGLCLADEEKPPVPVTIKSFEALQIYPRHSAPATVISLNHSQLSAQISARIKKISVRVGDKVSKGDTLIRLDCSEGKLMEQTARARLELAQKELQRAKALRRSNSIAEQGFNQAETELTQARVGIEQARLQVQRCTVSAPFAGIVTSRQAAEGELAVAGTALLKLLDSGRLEVSAQVSEQQTAAIRAAGKHGFKSGLAEFPLKLRVITPVINTIARNQEVRLTFSDKKAIPGSAGRLMWQSVKPHLPADLLVQRNHQTGVLIVKNDTARFVAAHNARIGHPAPIDLAGDAAIIVDGRFGLVDGDAVAIVSE